MRIGILGKSDYTLLQRRAKALAAYGHDVHVISTEESTIAGCTVHVLPPNRLLQRVKGHYVGLLPQARQLVKELRLDVVDIHGASSWGAYALLPSSEPRVMTIYGPDIYSHAASSRVLRQLVRTALTRVDLVLGSTGVIEEYVHQYTGLDLGNRLHTHSFGIPLTSIQANAAARRQQIRTEFGVDETTRVILHSRHIAELWRVDMVVEAFPLTLAQHPNSELWFAYPEPNEQGKQLLQQIQARAVELGCADKIRWIGFNPYERMISIMHAADVYVCIGKADLHASSIDEAISTGLVSILSNMPAYSDVIHNHKNGILLDDVTPAAVATEVNNALADFPALRARMTDYSERYILPELGIDAATKWVIAQYDEAINRWDVRHSVKAVARG